MRLRGNCQLLAKGLPNVAWQVLAFDAENLDAFVLGKFLIGRGPGNVGLSSHRAH
jgi:hypothetical protein